jgi:hypothetical protein
MKERKKSREYEETGPKKPDPFTTPKTFGIYESVFTQGSKRFSPDFVSTQLGYRSPGHHEENMGSIGDSELLPNLKGSSGMLGMGYNSQFDVEGQVDRVSEMLERDVDFDGWLKDVPEDEEDLTV